MNYPFSLSGKKKNFGSETNVGPCDLSHEFKLDGVRGQGLGDSSLQIVFVPSCVLFVRLVLATKHKTDQSETKTGLFPRLVPSCVSCVLFVAETIPSKNFLATSSLVYVDLYSRRLILKKEAFSCRQQVQAFY